MFHSLDEHGTLVKQDMEDTSSDIWKKGEENHFGRRDGDVWCGIVEAQLDGIHLKKTNSNDKTDAQKPSASTATYH